MVGLLCAHRINSKEILTSAESPVKQQGSAEGDAW